MRKENRYNIVPVHILFLCFFSGSSLYSQNPDWAAIKANSTFIVHDTSYNEPYIQPLNVGGWEDGLFMTRCGLHLYCGYWPADVFSWLHGMQFDPICFDFTPYFRPPLMGIDTVTNGWGCPNYMHGDIIRSSRASYDEGFTEWQQTNLQKPFSIEGAPHGHLKDANTWDVFVFTSNGDGFGNENIMFMSNVPIDADYTHATPILATPDIEHNPHIERIDGNTLIIFFDRGGYVYYSHSFNNGTDWEHPAVITNLINDQAPYDTQPHLWHDGTDWWMYFCADNPNNRRSIYRSKQLIANDWNSWAPKELVIEPGDINDGNPATFIIGIGEPTLTHWGDISFVVIYGDFSSSDTTDMFDCDPWFLPKKGSPVSSVRHPEKPVYETIQLYPNPTSDILHVNKAISGFKMTIYSVEGKIQYEDIIVGNSIDVSQLPNGIYIIMLTHESKTYSGKFIIHTQQ